MTRTLMRSHVCEWTLNCSKCNISVCMYVFGVANMHLGMIPGPTYIYTK